MLPREKAKEGLLLLQEAIIDIVKQNDGLSTTDIIRELSIETSDAGGRNKNFFASFILNCSEGRISDSADIGETLKALDNSKLESEPRGNKRCWHAK